MEPSLTPELCYDGTLDFETQAFLAQLTAQHRHTATSIAYMLKAHAAPPRTSPCRPLMGHPHALQMSILMGVFVTPTPPSQQVRSEYSGLVEPPAPSLAWRLSLPRLLT